MEVAAHVDKIIRGSVLQILIRGFHEKGKAHDRLGQCF